MTEVNYWLLGATWYSDKDGKIDKQVEFVQNKIWMLGYRKDGDVTQYNKAKQIKKGDRVAIKRNQGFADKPIRISTIGIVEGVTHDADRITCVVNWLVDKDILVESKGCTKTVHGPYLKEGNDKEWITEIFSL